MLNERGVRWGWDHELTFETTCNLSYIPIIDAIEHRANKVWYRWSLQKRGSVLFYYDWLEWPHSAPMRTQKCKFRLDAALAFARYFPVVKDRDGVPEGTEDTQNGSERTQDKYDDETVERLNHLGEDVDMIKDRLMDYGKRICDLEHRAVEHAFRDLTASDDFGPCLNKVRDDVAILKDRLNGVFEERLAKVEESLRRMGQ
jgi:hypothetical protein